MSIEAAGYKFTPQAASSNPLGGMRPFELRHTPLEFRAMSAPQVFQDNSHMVGAGVAQGLGQMFQGVQSAFVSDRESKAAIAKEEREHQRALQIETMRANRQREFNKERLDAMRQTALDRLNATGGTKQPVRYVDEFGGDYDEFEPPLPEDDERYRELNDENIVTDPNATSGADDDFLDFEPLPDLPEEEDYTGASARQPLPLEGLDLSAIPPQYLSAQVGGAGAPPAPSIPLSNALAPLELSLTENPIAAEFVPPAVEAELLKQRQEARRAASKAAVEKQAAAMVAEQDSVAVKPSEVLPLGLPKGFRPGPYRSFDAAMRQEQMPMPEGYEQPEITAKIDPATNEQYWFVSPPKRKKASVEKAESDFKDAQSLRKEFMDYSKDFREIQGSYRAIKEVAKKPSAAGDLSLVFSYMKLLDPGSVVREGEFASAANAAGVPDRIRAQYNKLMSGEILADKQRNDFLAQAKKLYSTRLKDHKQREQTYRQLAQNYGIDPSLVVVDLQVADPEQDIQDKINNIAGRMQNMERSSDEYRSLFQELIQLRKIQRGIATE